MLRKPILAVMAALFLLISVAAQAAGHSTVGNGDDGGDLEGTVPITSGPIVDARKEAVALLERLNTDGIRGLGILIPEVRGTTLHAVTVDKPATLPSDQGSFHGDMTGKVYARTIARPHAATRFFPIANNLSSGQLVALHIHEGLHRALPASVREDEPIVTQLTLAITSPEATHDQVRQIASKVVPDDDLRSMPPASSGSYGTTLTSRAEPIERFKQPSNIGLSTRYFFKSNDPSLYPLSFMHTIHSDLYPFGGVNTPFGMGIEGSVLQTDRATEVGPLGLSARLRLWSRRDFDIGIWGSASLNTLSNEKLKNSPFGRDVFTLGTSLRKKLKHFYVENFLSVNFAGTSRQTIGKVEYRYEYGEVLNVKIRGGARLGSFDIGAFTEMHLANYFRVNGGAFSKDTGRFRILSAGPEVTWSNENVAFSLFGRVLVAGTDDVSFDYLGNLMGPGVSRGSVGTSVSVFF